MIKALSNQVAEDLCAQQVITNICDCIKELIDNSIDAKATKIFIFLKDYGKQSIEVQDDGCGIGSFQFLGRKGSTSKNKGNVDEISTLGFRGEALHSLGKVSKKMTIVSTVEGKDSYKFDVKTLQSQTLNLKKSHGTSVTIEALFQFLPVRRYELLHKFKQFLKKIDEMIKEYCLIFPNISFIFKNTRQGKQDLLVETSIHGHSSEINKWKNRIAEVLGQKIADSLIYIETNLVKGWILKNIQSGSSKENSHIRRNAHYMYLNERPIDPLSKIVSLFDTFYRKYNKNTKYVFVLNLVLPWSSYDVNLTPNKRQILIKEVLVQKILEQIKIFVQKNVIEDIPALQDYDEKIKSKQKIINFLKKPQQKNVDQFEKSQNKVSDNEENMNQKNLNESDEESRQKIKDFISNKQQQNKTINIIHKETQFFPTTKHQQIQIISSKGILSKQPQSKNLQNNQTPIIKKTQEKQQKPSNSITNSNNNLIKTLNERMSMGSKKSIGSSRQKLTTSRKSTPQKQQQNNDDSKRSAKNQQMPLLKITNFNPRQKNQIPQQDLQQSIKPNLKIKPKLPLQLPPQSLSVPSSSKIDQNNQIAQDPLSPRIKHNILKQKFVEFQILGQFNHGFIVCFYQSKYYLIDQHAASQKFHFQKIINSVRNKTAIYQKINLNPIELESIQQHLPILQKDGYKLTIEQDHILLKQVPLFLNKIYGKEHLLDLVNNKKQLSQHPDYYNAAATKACRSAVMVGDVLRYGQMKEIVDQLSHLQSPWNCPHGRPTLIYLGNFEDVSKNIGEKRTFSLD